MALAGRGGPVKLVARLGLAALALVAGLVVAEQILRAVGYDYLPMTVNVRRTTDARLFHVFADENFIYDPEAIWRPRAGFGVFNSQGFRGPELAAEKREGELRIFALGDSNTLGWDGEEGANWPRDLGAILAARRPGIEVVNAGVWGYSSYQGLQRLRRVLEHDPDLVLISFGGNDAHRVARSDRAFASTPGAVRSLQQWLIRYRLGKLVVSAADRVTAPRQAEPTARVDLEDYRANLEEMVLGVRAAGAEAVLMTRPYEGGLLDETWWKNFGREYNLATVEVAESLGAPLVDLYSFFKARPRLFGDESHFTDEGHRRAAEIVAVHLRPLLAPPSPKGAERRARRRPA